MNTLAVFHSCACTDGEKKRKSTIFPIYPITDGCKMHLNLKKKKKNQRGGANYLKGKRTERNLRIGRGWRASSEDWRVICACESVLGHGFSCRIVFSFARACVRACMRARVRAGLRERACARGHAWDRIWNLRMRERTRTTSDDLCHGKLGGEDFFKQEKDDNNKNKNNKNKNNEKHGKW